jgi:hypothetical protein
VRSARWFIVLLALAAACSGTGLAEPPGADVPADAITDTVADVPPALPKFRRHVVDAQATGAAYAEVADLDGDGVPELVVSLFGKPDDANFYPDGQVVVYKRGQDLDHWTRSVILSGDLGVKYPNRPTVADVNGDGRPDVIVAAGFLLCTLFSEDYACGSLQWMEQTETGWTRHLLVEGTVDFYHRGLLLDVDGDHRDDLVTVAEHMVGMAGDNQGAVTRWFKGVDGADRFDPAPRDLAAGMGSLFQAVDVDGDGDTDLCAAEFFVAGESVAWLEQKDGQWIHHVIDADSGPSIQFALVPNLFGDGVARGVGSNHVNTQDDATAPESAIRVYDRPVNPADPWTKRVVSQGIQSVKSPVGAPQQAPGVFGWGDIDGDGRIDLAVSGDGDPRVLWLQQVAPGQFETQVLEASLPEASGMQVVDLDGNGTPEIVVTGYTDNVVYVYERE